MDDVVDGVFPDEANKRGAEEDGRAVAGKRSELATVSVNAVNERGVTDILGCCEDVTGMTAVLVNDGSEGNVVGTAIVEVDDIGLDSVAVAVTEGTVAELRETSSLVNVTPKSFGEHCVA